MTAPHNLANDLATADFPTSGRMGKTPEGYVFGWGTTVGNDVEDWAPGALFVDTDGSGQTLVFKNIGTAATADFQPISNNQTSVAQIMIPLGLLTLEDGTALTKFSNGDNATPGFQQVSNKEIILRWNNHATPTKVGFSVKIPEELDDAEDVQIGVLVKLSGSTDTPVLEFESYFDVGDTDCAGTDPEITAGTTLTEELNTIDAADVPPGSAVSGALTVLFGPKAGELGTDDVLVYGIVVQYTRKPQSI